MAKPEQIETVARHFIIAALWADCEEGTNPRAPMATQETARRICAAFIAKNEALFAEAMERKSEGYGSHPDAGSPEAAFGHDLWLTIQGHGVGFFDRKELENIDHEDIGVSLGDKLNAACEPYRYKLTPEFYRGWLYLNTYGIDDVKNSESVQRFPSMQRCSHIEVSGGRWMGGQYKPGYRWVQGWIIRYSPNRESTPVRYSEARAMLRDAKGEA